MTINALSLITERVGVHWNVCVCMYVTKFVIGSLPVRDFQYNLSFSLLMVYIPVSWLTNCLFIAKSARQKAGTCIYTSKNADVKLACWNLIPVVPCTSGRGSCSEQRELFELSGHICMKKNYIKGSKFGGMASALPSLLPLLCTSKITWGRMCSLTLGKQAVRTQSLSLTSLHNFGCYVVLTREGNWLSWVGDVVAT